MRHAIMLMVVGLLCGCANQGNQQSFGVEPISTVSHMGVWQAKQHYMSDGDECFLHQQSSYSKPVRAFFRTTWPNVSVITSPEKGIINAVAFHMAVDQAKDASPVVVVDAQEFRLVVDGEYARPANAKIERELIEKLKKASKAVAMSVSKDGTKVEDHYEHLTGFENVLDLINKTCAAR
ncbi:MAG: hypothetical protein ACFCUR_09605 [Rhodomicrobiaceae bacterium]